MVATAIILGGSHHNTLGLIRSLGRAGLKPFVLLHDGNDRSYVLRSQYVGQYAVVPDVAAIIPFLKERKTQTGKPVVFCASDGAASVIDLHWEELADAYCLPGCGRQGEVNRLMDKGEMARLAAECGLRVPASIEVETDHPECNGLRYPCIVKPLQSIAGSKMDIAVCYDRDQLLACFQKCRAPRVQVQEFIDKEMEYQLIGARWEKTLIPGRSRILSQPLCTNTGFLHYERLDGSEPLAACESFLEKTAYRGLFSLEFIRDHKGNDYFMEINFRNDGNAISVTDAGVNLPYYWYQQCLGIASDEGLSGIRDLYVMPEFDELSLWSAQGIRCRQMRQEFRKSDSYMEYAPDDPAPTRGRMALMGRFLVTALIKRPYRILSGKNRNR